VTAIVVGSNDTAGFMFLQSARTIGSVSRRNFSAYHRWWLLSSSSSSSSSSSTSTYSIPLFPVASKSSPTSTTTTTTTLAMSTDASTVIITNDNPLLDQGGLPRFESIEPKYLTPAMELLLEKLEQDFQQLEVDLSAKGNNTAALEYDEVLPKVEQIQFALGYAWGVAGHLNGVKNGDELREAYEMNQPKVVQATSKFSQSKPLYDALSALEAKWKEEEEGKGQDDITEDGLCSSSSFLLKQKRRAVEISLRGMKLGGVGLEGDEKERFNEIKLRLAALATSFSNNVLDDTKAFSLTVEDTSTMEGVPESARAQWANSHIQYLKSQQAAGDEGEKGGSIPELDPVNGPFRITLDMPSYLPAAQHLRDRSLRETVYKAYIKRASDGEKNNLPLINEILSLRKEMAAMLGYNNYAELSIAKKMAPSVEAVAELTDLMAAKAIPAAKKELEEITALARAQGGVEYSEENLDKLQPWDIAFWSERLKESRFDMTDEELRPYFALPAVLDGMFGLLKRLFNVDVQAADGEAEVWNPDVRFFKIFDISTGKHIASFFLDPYSRPENKRGGAWMADCVGKSDAVKRDIPVAYLTCNGSPPVGTKPSLMTFREVETLFHETGHGLQHMLTDATVGDVAGINGIEWDAVEVRCCSTKGDGRGKMDFSAWCSISPRQWSVSCIFSFILINIVDCSFLHNLWRIGAMIGQLCTVLRSTGRRVHPSPRRNFKSCVNKRFSMLVCRLVANSILASLT
jgi:oligopeptidase A